MLVVQLIPGVMFGVEWVYEIGIFVVDLGIFRVIFDYR